MRHKNQTICNNQSIKKFLKRNHTLFFVIFQECFIASIGHKFEITIASVTKESLKMAYTKSKNNANIKNHIIHQIKAEDSPKSINSDATINETPNITTNIAIVAKMAGRAFFRLLIRFFRSYFQS
jgi:sRNA-binding carbon storage regulator CsrA